MNIPVKKKHTLCIFAIVWILLLCVCYAHNPSRAATTYQEQDLDYSDSCDSLDNPARGFYATQGLHLTKSGNRAVNPSAHLVHLRVDIAAFSSRAILDEKQQIHGEDGPLTDDALTALTQTLSNIKARGNSVIIRVCYDPWYNGKSNFEPEQSLILQHLQQLGAIYQKHTDVIAGIELGMYGPWGEMHTSKCCTKSNISQALNTLLAATGPDIKISVRTPDYVAGWLGISPKDFDRQSAVFQKAVSQKGDYAYRVGLFNDGYLGSSSDLGTYLAIPREKAVDWLKEYAQYTLYGGEVVANAAGGTIGDYNSISYIAQEAFQTHTSYLNCEWNDSVLKAWKNDIYHNPGDEYDGTSGYKYVADHLGYRLLLRKSSLCNGTPSQSLTMHLSIENVGFANVVHKPKVSFIFAKETTGSTRDTVYELPCSNLDITRLSGASLTTYTPQVDLPASMETGTYRVYLRFSRYGDYKTDQNYQCIRFGNKSDYWSSAYGANYIGKLSIVPAAQPAHTTTDSTTSDTTNTTDTTASTSGTTGTSGTTASTSDTAGSPLYNTTAAISDTTSAAATTCALPAKNSIKKGTLFQKRKRGIIYRITATGKKHTVSVHAYKGSSKTITIPATVTFKGTTYRVTAIDKRAFSHCKKLRKIILKKRTVKISKAVYKSIRKKVVIKLQKAA